MSEIDPTKLPHDHGDYISPGALRRIYVLEERLRKWLKAIIVFGILGVLGWGFTGWQVARAFDKQEEERVARIGAQSSINAYFCRKIDEVGDGVAALVAVSLKNTPPRESLTPTQREGFDQFNEYLEQQQRPPRCRDVALKLAILTGANPEDVEITQLHIYKDE